MPSSEVGAALLSHRPSAVTHSPALTAGNDPTTVTSSRCPLLLTLSTAKPFSSLKKVTRSIRPDRLSGGGGGCACNQMPLPAENTFPLKLPTP